MRLRLGLRVIIQQLGDVQFLEGVRIPVHLIQQQRGAKRRVEAIIIIMGCISQNGCLGPRRREKEIYTELIDQIYSDADQEGNKQAPFLIDPAQSFAAIKVRTSKKGGLRKLIDHLLSHRNKINQCLNYNLRLATQTRSTERKIAGLLIIDEITSKVYKVAKVESLDEGPISKGGSTQTKQLLDQHEMKVGADLRFDLAYFRLILHLLQSEKQLIEVVLNSILNFCAGRKERFGCKAEVWRVLELLLQHLQRGDYKQKAAKCYLNLLQLLKEGGKEESSHEGDLSIFFRLWQKEEEEEPDSANQQDFHHTIFRILKLFVNRCMSSWDAKVLFRALFQVYEDDKFTVSRLVKLQGMIIGIILQHDLHSHILRGLFLYLLEFISASPPEKANFRSSFNQEFQLQRYPHVYDRGVRFRLFQTLRRWGEKGYINLDESVTFSSSSLVAAYTANFKGEREYVQEIVRQFFKLTDMLSPKSNLIVVNLLLDEIRWVKTDEAVRRLLINLTREVLELSKLMQQPMVNCCNLFVTIDPSFSKETRVELIQLMGFIVRNLSLQQLTNSDQQGENTAQTICQLFYSLYQGSKTLFQPNKQKPREEEEILPRYQYANCLLSLLKCFIQKSAYLYAICFITAVTDRLSNEPTRLALYFQLYFIYEGLHLINHKNKLPDRMMSINFKISPSAKVAQEIDTFILQLAGAKGEMLPKIRTEILTQLKNLQDFTMLSDLQYRQMQQSFQCYFKPTAPKESQLLSSLKGDQSRTQFKRESVNNSFYQSCHDSKEEDDNSFKDVVDRIIEI